MPTSSGSDLPQDMLQCIELCNDCHKACLETVMYCLQQGGNHAEANHVRQMFDCAEICQTSANFMQRGSDLHVHTCAACAAVCRRCAEDCRRCAEFCEHMSHATA